MKKAGIVKNSGPADTLPENRFLRNAPPKYPLVIAAGVIILIYLILPYIRAHRGQATLTVTYPLKIRLRNAPHLTITGTGTTQIRSPLKRRSRRNALLPTVSWQKAVYLLLAS